MVCAGCARAVEETLEKDPRVAGARVSLLDQSVIVTHKPGARHFNEWRKAVKSAGFTLMKSGAAGDDELRRELRSLKLRALVAAALAATVFSLNMFFRSPAADWAQAALAAFGLVFSGGPVFVKAFKLLTKGRSAMETLIALGVSAAFGVSIASLVGGNAEMLFFEAAMFVLAFILLGKWAEISAQQKARDSAGEFLQSAAKLVLRKTDSGWEEAPASAVNPGDLLRVLPGERVPADGQLESAAAELDEHWITGESDAAVKRAGAPVFAGSLNAGGPFVYAVEADAQSSRLHKLAQAVKTAEASRAPVQRLADKIVGVFVPVILALAALTFAGWHILEGDLSAAVARGLSVLVISCPCALGLAAPLVIRLALQKTARDGALFRDAAALERLASINRVVFDKTGTLTEGRPSVSAAYWTENAKGEADNVRRVALASSHPAARGVAAYLAHPEASDGARFSEDEEPAIEEIPGRGMAANFGGARYLLGNEKLLESRGARIPEVLEHKLAEQGDKTVSLVLAAKDGVAIALFALQDGLKPGAESLIQDLKARGITPALLSGDRKPVVKALAEKLNIADWRAGVSPQDKADYIEKAQNEGEKVLMAGDGVNDAIAIARADASVSVTEGSDLAMEKASALLLEGRLGGLLSAFRTSRKAKILIRQNLFWAFVYNLVALPVAAGLVPGFTITPALSGGAMALSSITVVLNSLRMR